MATLPANIDEQIEQQTKRVMQAEKPTGGQFISLNGGKFSMGELRLPDKLQVVTVGWIRERQYYAEKYNPNEQQIPACFGFQFDDEQGSMVPDEEAKQKQHSQCDGCPRNEWGTSETGRGKACKEVRRLALMSADSIKSNILGAEIAYIKVPVMSVINWKKYVQDVAAAFAGPPWAVVTELAIEQDKVAQFKLTFRAAAPIPREYWNDLYVKSQSTQAQIDFPYKEIEKPAQPARRTRVG